MFRKNILPAFAALFFLSFAPLPASAGGLADVCADIGPDVISLLNRYAMTDAQNFCVRAMTLAETRCYRQRDQVIREANVISRQYNLAPVVPGCQPLMAAVPPPPAPVYYQPAPLLAAGPRETVSHGSRFASSWWLLGLLPLIGLAFIPGGGDHHESHTLVTNIDDEFNAQYSLAVIGLTSTGANGSIYKKYTGQGVAIGLIDTGVDTSHPEFAGRIVADGGYDFINNRNGMPSAADLNPHGTEVAGVMAANRNFIGMHGVAYGALIDPLRVFDHFGTSLDSSLQDGFAPAINYSVNHGDAIINGSYGPDDEWHNVSSAAGHQIIIPEDLAEGAAYLNAASKGVILVFPAGNNYSKNPDVAANPTGPGFLPFIRPSNKDLTSVTAGAYRDILGNVITQDFSGMQANTIVVVGTDAKGTILSYSNRCGVAAAWCMAAPADNIYTTIPNGNYAALDGTSFAAPQVAGAAAILKQEFPSLSGA
ncbi:MAG TPA: S8 family peptidase, partial [Alphaproteobacteria bacterium]|nr:S8 family peptidase [Alphaproteobacteria bacterium]